jgi:hypothetical protein
VASVTKSEAVERMPDVTESVLEPVPEETLEEMLSALPDEGTAAETASGYANEEAKLYIGREFTPEEFAGWWKAQGLGTRPFNAVGILPFDKLRSAAFHLLKQIKSAAHTFLFSALVLFRSHGF